LQLAISYYASGFREGETPVPISNTAVKPFIADGTAFARLWESRLPLALFLKTGTHPFFCENFSEKKDVSLFFIPLTL
jgi:hypothetical protein